MFILSNTFLEELSAAWGNPRDVAKAAIAEVFSHSDIFTAADECHHDYIRDVSVLAGISMLMPKSAFIGEFVHWGNLTEQKIIAAQMKKLIECITSPDTADAISQAVAEAVTD